MAIHPTTDFVGRGFLAGIFINDSIIIKLAETDEELCGRGYVHCTSWQEDYRGIVCDQYLDSMIVEATTARARKFPENTHGFEFDGCKKQWNLGTPVSIVRMVKIRRIENIGGNVNL